jgi:hypothetical protein
MIDDWRLTIDDWRLTIDDLLIVNKRMILPQTLGTPNSTLQTFYVCLPVNK